MLTRTLTLALTLTLTLPLTSGSIWAESSSGGMTKGRYGLKSAPRHLQMRAHAW